MSVYVLLAIAERAHSFYESVEAHQFVRDVWAALSSVYSDIAQAHFTSAQSALEAARYSRHPEAEVRASIGHLRDAFNIYETLLSQRKSKRFLLFWTDQVSVVPWHQEKKVKSALFEIATCIALNYVDLNERANALKWKDTALGYLQYYCDVATAHLKTYDYDKPGWYELQQEYIRQQSIVNSTALQVFVAKGLYP